MCLDKSVCKCSTESYILKFYDIGYLYKYSSAVGILFSSKQYLGIKCA